VLYLFRGLTGVRVSRLQEHCFSDIKVMVGQTHELPFLFLTPSHPGWRFLQKRSVQTSMYTYLGIQILLGVGTSDWIHGRLIGVG
jgi:hypothetical protein